MGFAGLAASLYLDKRKQPGTVVTLIDRHRYHQFNATLYEVATAWMPDMPEGALGVLKRSNCIPVEQLLLRMPSVRFVQAAIAQLNPKGSTLTLADGTVVPYDALIVALGSETDDLGIPGVAQYGVGLKTVEDAMRIRNDMETAVADAAQDHRSDRPVHVLIGGGGFSGSELSAELRTYARVLSRAYRFDPKRIHIEILEGAPHLLPGLGEWASGRIEQRLTKLGVRLRLNTKVVRVTAADVEIQGGECVPFDLFVWTGGVRANTLVRESGLSVDHRGRLTVSPNFQTSEANIFSVGDTITLKLPGSKYPLPWVASLATKQGQLAAANVQRFLAGSPLKAFSDRSPGYVIPVGGKYALAVLTNGIRFAGFPAWVLRQLINLKYFLSVLGPLEALRLWFIELTYYSRNDA